MEDVMLVCMVGELLFYMMRRGGGYDSVDMNLLGGM